MKHQRVILEGDFWVASLLSSGTASLLRIASAARSGSPGGPGRWCRERVGAAKDSNPFVDLLFEFVFVDEAVDLDGAEEVGSLQILPAQREDELSESPVRFYHLDFGD